MIRQKKGLLTAKGYTKHYFEEGRRVCSKIGGGHLDVIQSQSNWDGTGKPPAYMQEVSDRLFKESLKQVYERVLMKNDPDCITEIYEYVNGLHHPIDGIPERVKAEVAVELKDFRNNVRDMRGYLHDERKNVYYYHSDHLGSASWITNHNGNAVQHLQYLPYGEPYVNIRTTGYSERFTFTGKERDEETGFGYFGARYMDHELMTMWLSVDPMSDKYPSISPYAYCAWNPVKLVDPDGREIGDYYNFNGTYMGWDGNYDDKVYIVNDSKCGYKRDASGRIDQSSISPEITTTYSALEAVQGVYNRTVGSNGIYEESALVIGSDLQPVSVKGSHGYYDNDGNPHCTPPKMTEEQNMLSGLGLTSVHSHPFELVRGILENSYHTSKPSSDDKELFKSCNMNVIVGYLTDITKPSQAYPQTTENIGATFYSSSFEKIGSVKMSSINKIVMNKQNAREMHIKNMIKGL